MYIIMVYDISNDDNGAAVWRKVFQINKQYLFRIQNSVFEGNITKVQYEDLKYRLKRVLRSQDSCIVFLSRNEKWLKKEYLTEKVDDTSNYL